MKRGKTTMIHFKTISEPSMNMISYAHDAKKNKIWKSIYLENVKN